MNSLLLPLVSSAVLLLTGCHGWGYDVSVRGRVLCPDGSVPWGPHGDDVSCGSKRPCFLAYVKLYEADGAFDFDDYAK